jgi:hypothetical protein
MPSATRVGSGLGSSLGSSIESSYGASAAPNLWHGHDSWEIVRRPVYFKGNTLRGGDTLVRDAADRQLTNQDAGGSGKQNFYYSGTGRLIASLMGSLASTPVQIGSTTAYTRTCNFGQSNGQSLSFQQGIPDTSGSVHWFQTVGAKITEGQFECAAGGSLMWTPTVDAQDWYELGPSAGTTPTEPIGDVCFAWQNMTVKIGAYGSEAKVDGCTKWTGIIKRTYDDKRFFAGNLTTNPSIAPPYTIKSEPVDNGFADIGGTLETQYLNDSLYENYYLTETPFSLIVSFVSTALAGAGNPFSVTFGFPRCYFITDGPKVTGPDIVKPSMQYEVWYDDTHPAATCTIVSTDSVA